MQHFSKAHNTLTLLVRPVSIVTAEILKDFLLNPGLTCGNYGRTSKVNKMWGSQIYLYQAYERERVTCMTRRMLVRRLLIDDRDSMKVDWNDRQKHRSTNDGINDNSYRNLSINIRLDITTTDLVHVHSTASLSRWTSRPRPRPFNRVTQPLDLQTSSTSIQPLDLQTFCWNITCVDFELLRNSIAVVKKWKK